MKKKSIFKNIFMYVFIMVASFCSIQSVKAVYSDSQVGSYESELAKFPTDYQEKIKKLHNTYPNAVFVVQDMFLDWYKYKEVPVSWNDMLTAELKDSKSLIWYTAPSSYKDGKFNSEGTWYYASKTAVEYYMNPYNFLDETHVFMFQSQYYNPAETEAGVNGILTDAYKNKECPGSGGKTYAQVILYAAKENNISAYMLASRLRQENPKGTESLVTGRCVSSGSNCTKYYNLYNIQASGSSDSEVISNGANCAAGKTSYCSGNNWDSPYKSILGGAEFLYDMYIGINDTYNVKGQMTNYLQKWDPYGPYLGGHQYMQNIQAPYTESTTTYGSNMNYVGKNFKYIFYIPIYQGAPNTERRTPVETNTNTNTNSDKKYVSGDVNGDGKISALDYVKVKNHITGANVITDENVKKAADFNNDGKISALDYVKIKNYIIKGGE